MTETRAILATVAVISLFVGLVNISTVLLIVGLVASLALLLHESGL